MSKHVLVAGGTGFIGKHLVKHLTDKQYGITIVSRMPGLRHITWHELEKNGIPDGVTDVVNLAGQNVLDPRRRWTAGFKQNVWNSRINTSSAMVKAIENAPKVKSFINITGVSHYASNTNKVHKETDAVSSFDFMSKLCVAWEKAATVNKPIDKICRGIILRTGVVVGRDGGIIKSMWLPFFLGLGGPIGSGKQILPWIHIDDLCGLITHCIDHETSQGILNAVAPQIITNEEFSKAFAAALHRPCLFAVPDFVIKLIFGADRSPLLLTGAKIEPAATLKTGYQFKYPTVKAACENVVHKSANASIVI